MRQQRGASIEGSEHAKRRHMPRKERFLGNCEVFCFLWGRGLAGGTLASAAVMREGHRSEWQSTKGGVVVGGPLQCWEAGVCLQTRPPRGMERGGASEASRWHWWGSCSRWGAAVSALRSLAWLRRPGQTRRRYGARRTEGSRGAAAPTAGASGRGRGGLEGRPLAPRAGLPAARLATVSRLTASRL